MNNSMDLTKSTRAHPIDGVVVDDELAQSGQAVEDAAFQDADVVLHQHQVVHQRQVVERARLQLLDLCCPSPRNSVTLRETR